MEKHFDCIKFHFHTPLHLSRGRQQYDESARILHSDTLMGALFTAAMLSGATASEALAMLDGCRVSSAFPFLGEEYFFPKPMAPLPFNLCDTPDERAGKSFKKIRFLGKSWFEKALHGETADIQESKHLAQKEYLSEHVLGTIMKANVTQRVTIKPDHDSDSEPFYTERLFFGEKAGLFALVEWRDPAVKDLFFLALRMLGDLGIGTDRAVGNGFFTPETNRSLLLRVPDVANYQCNLGLYLPQEGELTVDDFENSTWSLTKRGGYMAGASNPDHITLRKLAVFMFETGSVFPKKPLEGKREDLKPVWNPPLHEVWREGRTVFVPIIRLEELNN